MPVATGKILVIPAIDILGGACVRLSQGDYGKKTIYPERPEDAAVRWLGQGAEWLHLVDLDGAKNGFPVNTGAVGRITAAVEIPCEVGGGVRSRKDAEAFFGAGVRRVIVGTAAIENPALVRELLAAYSPEKTVVGIDARDGIVAVRGWVETAGKKAVEIAAEMAAAGVRRFIYTDISRDGMLSGPNIQAVSLFCGAVAAAGAAVIASGGISSCDDIAALRKLAVSRPNLEGVIVGKALYEERFSLKEAIASAEA